MPNDANPTGVGQFLYFWSANPQAESTGYEIHMRSPAVIEDELPTLRSFCYFSPLQGQTTVALVRRTFNGRRAALMMKRDLGHYDRRYLVHGLVGSLQQLNMLRSLQLAISDLWNHDIPEFEQASQTLDDVDLNSIPPGGSASVFPKETAELLWQLESTHFLDFGAEFFESAQILRAVAACACPYTRQNAEFEIGERSRSFGTLPSLGFTRVMLKGESQQVTTPDTERQIRQTVEWVSQDPLSPWLSCGDPRASYALGGSISRAYFARAEADIITSLATLSPDERLCALASEAVAAAVCSQLSHSPRWQEWVSTLGRSSHPVDPGGGADIAREIYQHDAEETARNRNYGRAALVARIWALLAIFESRVPIFSDGIDPWFRRYLKAHLLSGVGNIQPARTAPEAFPPQFLSVILTVDPEIPPDEIVESLVHYGSEAFDALHVIKSDAHLIAQIYRRCVDRLPEDLSRLKLLDSLSADHALRIALQSERESAVLRQLLKTRPDISPQLILGIVGDVSTAARYFLRDIPQLDVLLSYGTPSWPAAPEPPQKTRKSKRGGAR